MDSFVTPLFMSDAPARRSSLPPRPAPDDPFAEATLAALVLEATQHEAVRHPYLQDLAAGRLPDPGWALADFASLYQCYSAHFPRFVAVVLSKLDRPDHRRALLANLSEENGQLEPNEVFALVARGIDPGWVVGVPHPELFRRFAAAVRAPAARADDLVDAECWRELFYALLVTGTPAEAVGALGLGTELIVKHVYRSILEGIRRHGRLSRRDYVFFELHCEVDDAHGETLLAIARDLARDRAGLRDLRKGMRKALALRSAFWSALHRRALDRDGHEVA